MAEFVGEREGTAFMLSKDSDAPVERLTRRLQTLKEFLVDGVARDCRNFAETITDWRDNELWKHFAESWDEFIVTQLEKPVEWVELILKGWEVLDQNKPIPEKKAIAAAKKVGRPPKPEGEPVHHRPETLAKAEKVAELRAQGMTQQEVADELGISQTLVSRTEENITQKPDNVRILCNKKNTDRAEHGNSKDYTIARLLRDGHEDLAGQVQSGVISASEARRQVGWETKKKKQLQVTDTTDPAALAQRLIEFDPDLAIAIGKAILHITGHTP